MDVFQGELGESFVCGSGAEKGRVSEGGIGELTAEFEFLLGEARVVVMASELNGG